MDNILARLVRWFRLLLKPITKEELIDWKEIDCMRSRLVQMRFAKAPIVEQISQAIDISKNLIDLNTTKQNSSIRHLFAGASKSESRRGSIEHWFPQSLSMNAGKRWNSAVQVLSTGNEDGFAVGYKQWATYSLERYGYSQETVVDCDAEAQVTRFLSGNYRGTSDLTPEGYRIKNREAMDAVVSYSVDVDVEDEDLPVTETLKEEFFADESEPVGVQQYEVQQYEVLNYEVQPAKTWFDYVWTDDSSSNNQSFEPWQAYIEGIHERGLGSLDQDLGVNPDVAQGLPGWVGGDLVSSGKANPWGNY